MKEFSEMIRGFVFTRVFSSHPDRNGMNHTPDGTGVCCTNQLLRTGPTNTGVWRVGGYTTVGSIIELSTYTCSACWTWVSWLEIRSPARTPSMILIDPTSRPRSATPATLNRKDRHPGRGRGLDEGLKELGDCTIPSRFSNPSE